MIGLIILLAVLALAVLAVFSAHIPGLRRLTGAEDYTRQQDDLSPFFDDYRPEPPR